MAWNGNRDKMAFSLFFSFLLGCRLRRGRQGRRDGEGSLGVGWAVG